MLKNPLVIDLDGTLIKSDLLIETGLLFVRDNPGRVLAPLFWLMRGKAALKQELAHATEIDVSVLPYDPDVLALIELERGRGRNVVLATASHRKLAEQVANHLGLFDRVIATEGRVNNAADAKRDLLLELFGDGGFDYVGNSADDLPIWRVAREAYVVNAGRSVENRAKRHGNVAQIFRSDDSRWRAWLKALRVHQWPKNLLVFIPLLSAHRYAELPLLADALLAFLSFSLCASSVYLFNDLLDLRDDRHHELKRSRPLASGRLSIQSGLLATPALLIAAFALAAWQLPIAFLAGLSAYFVLTVAYSFVLKRRMVIDVITLAALYTMRIIAGGLALGIALSFWLLAFSMFLFLSLALVKRYAELFRVRGDGGRQQARGRGYYADDLGMLASLGGASGYIAVLVLALYINDNDTTGLYTHPEIIWLACPLLLTWISRVWMLAHRGLMNEDPVIFALRDRISLAIAALLAAVFWAAT